MKEGLFRSKVSRAVAAGALVLGLSGQSSSEIKKTSADTYLGGGQLAKQEKESLNFTVLDSAELKQFVGRPWSEVREYVMEKYSTRVPDFNHYNSLLSMPSGKVLEELKHGKYYVLLGTAFPLSSIPGITKDPSNDPMVVPMVNWRGSPGRFIKDEALSLDDKYEEGTPILLLSK